MYFSAIMNCCSRHRVCLTLLIAVLLTLHGNVAASWLNKEPVSSLPDEVDHIVAACQEENLFLKCRNRYNRLVIKDTFYGRANNHTCASKTFDTDKTCKEPATSTKQKVHLMCNGENKCKIPVTPIFLEKHGTYICRGVRKYLQITYACHQHPHLHMVCRNNCSSKCWPLCQKDCCHPRVITIAKKTTEHIKVIHPERNLMFNCAGDCNDACAPSCLPSCCYRQNNTYLNQMFNQAPPIMQQPKIKQGKKALLQPPVSIPCSVGCPTYCKPLCGVSCCRGGSFNKHPNYIPPFPPVSTCPSGCSLICSPACNPLCCHSYLPTLPFQYSNPFKQTYINPQEGLKNYPTQPFINSGYRSSINQQPQTFVNSRYKKMPNTQLVNYPQQQYQKQGTDCRESCRSSCDATCSLRCCVNPQTYMYANPVMLENEQRKRYQLLLQKFRVNQLRNY